MLLRMLEPAVRPTGPAPAAAGKKPAQPFEHRSFESLLSQAQQAGTDPVSQLPGQDAQASIRVAEATTRTDTLGPLSGLGTVENATLRQIMANHADAADHGD